MSLRLKLVLRILVALAAILAAVGAAFLAWLSAGPSSSVDFGEHRAVVLHSDDWGLEAWFPDGATAKEFEDLTRGLPQWLQTYAKSSLERPEDVHAVAGILRDHVDADGLPAVLQTNVIVAGPTLAASTESDVPWGWPVHPSGEGRGRYARPGLREAVDAAIAEGLWWPELHGLTHFDLFAYRDRRRAGDGLAERAAARGVFAYEGWVRDAELDANDLDRARSVVAEAVRLFEARYGRRPASVVAPDYRWGPEDEVVWAEWGLRVVQAKREQVDRSLAPFGLRQRLRKWIRRLWDARVGKFTYVERSADLEPYGDPSDAAVQGAEEAVAAVARAWRRGDPGVVSIHRAQLVSLDSDVAAAGRLHLERCLAGLQVGGKVRFLVDDEVDQLRRRGWSVIRRGARWIVRNWTDDAVEIVDPRSGTPRTFAPGTYVLGPAEAIGNRTADTPN